jgi:branched-chain amino acid transport system substrate-binding protein
MADWASKNGLKKVYTMVTDYGPGIDAETYFKKTFTADGGTIVGEVRFPLKNPDYAPFVQRAKDAQPEAVFAFVPAGESAALMKQFGERGLKAAGVKLIGTGDVPDDDVLDGMGPEALDMITSHHYSAAHDSPENKAFVAAFEAANGGKRPNFMGVGGYDGMRLIYEVLKKTNGNTAGDAFIAAAKGLTWTSPRGPVKIEPDTREITQNIYIRKVERVDGHLFNVEFATYPMVKDPAK